MTDRDLLRERLQQAIESDFAIVRLLGRGGMGAVYLARELALDRLVAIKVLPAEAANVERRARFRREAQLAAKLSHPNIVPLHSFGDRGGLSFYVMGFVRGESLADRIRRDGTIPSEEARHMLAELADSLEYAHGKGIVHRDIKPDNILLDDETGRPMLADFGIAQKTDDAGQSPGRIEGTLHFMSPEQAAGAASLDGRTDVYALGVVGYMMLSGRTPFTAETFAEFTRQQSSCEVPPLSALAGEAPADLSAALMRSLARHPEQRWASARALKEALGAALDDDPERLPGELREVAGAVLYSLLGGWVLVNAGPLVVPSVPWLAAALGAVLPAAAYAGTASVHRRKGIRWSDMWRVALWPPAWWPFWWPRGHRRPGDVWDRLPAVVRRIRTTYGAIAVALLAAVPVLFRGGRDRVVLVLGGLQLAITATMLFTAWWAHRNGIPNNADLRSLILRSTSDRRFWKRPHMARRLLSLPDKQKPVGSPRTPADYVRHISDGVQKLSGQARDTSVHALEVARLAYSLIVRIETDLGALGLADDDRESLTGRRERVVSDLHTLYERHQSLLLDQSDQAILGLSEAVQSLAVALSGTEDGSLSARTHGATGLEVTAAAHTKAKTVDGQRRGSSQNCAS